MSEQEQLTHLLREMIHEVENDQIDTTGQLIQQLRVQLNRLVLDESKHEADSVATLL